MDAERRHELKQNDFAEAITKLREVNWSDPRITYWTVGIALVIVIFVGYRVMQYRAATQVSSAYQALGEVEVTNTALGDAPLDTLQRIIDDNPQPGVVGIATLRLALGKQERDDIEAAQRDYEKIIAMQGTPLAIQAAATYQLGKTYEEQRDFDGARQAYARLTEGSEFIGQPYVEMAKARLDTLSELAVNVAFESGTRPLEAVEAQPKEQRLFSQPPNLSTLSTAARRPDAEPAKEKEKEAASPTAEEEQAQPETPAADTPAAPKPDEPATADEPATDEPAAEPPAEEPPASGSGENESR